MNEIRDEAALVQILLHFPEHLDAIRDDLSGDDFADTEVGDLYASLKASVRDGGRWDEMKRTMMEATFNPVIGRISKPYVAHPRSHRGDPTMVVEYAKRIRDESLRRTLAKRLKRAARAVWESEGMDPQEAVTYAIKEIGSVDVQTNEVANLAAEVEPALDRYGRWDRQEGGDFLPTGFPKLDSVIEGLRVGRVTTLGMLSGAGKTSWMCQVANAVSNRFLKAGEESGILIFSAEMDRSEIFDRIVSLRAGVNLRKFRSESSYPGRREDYAKLKHEARNMRQCRIWVDQRARPTLEYITAKAHQLNARVPLRLIAFDYVEKAGTEDATEELRISSTVQGLSQVAKEMGVPVLLLSQLNRNYAKREDPTPRITDIRYSGMIEAESFCVILAYTPYAIVAKGLQCGDFSDAEYGKCWMIVNKHRAGLAGVRVRMNFEPEYTRFRDQEDSGEYSHNPWSPLVNQKELPV